MKKIIIFKKVLYIHNRTGNGVARFLWYALTKCKYKKTHYEIAVIQGKKSITHHTFFEKKILKLTNTTAWQNCMQQYYVNCICFTEACYSYKLQMQYHFTTSHYLTHHSYASSWLASSSDFITIDTTHWPQNDCSAAHASWDEWCSTSNFKGFILYEKLTPDIWLSKWQYSSHFIHESKECPINYTHTQTTKKQSIYISFCRKHLKLKCPRK